MKPYHYLLAATCMTGLMAGGLTGCKPKATAAEAVSGDVASQVYVAPGKMDEFYLFTSGGFSGQMGVYGLPSGRLLREIPVFSLDPESGYGMNEETKDMLNTSYGMVPWDDTHHPELSQTGGVPDGRWLFVNANNTPRIARISLSDFRTSEILEIPHSGGNHSSAFVTGNTEYVVAGTRFSIPMGENTDVSIDTYKDNFKGTITFVGVDPATGHMKPSFQIMMPGLNFDLAHAGKGPSEGWFFFSCYNSEQAGTLLEVNASANDKDFIIAINWKKAEEYMKAGKGKPWKSTFLHHVYNHKKHMTESEVITETIMLDPKELTDMVYFIPCPKSPHGCDVDPSGEYICAGGKLAATIPVYSFTKIQKAIADKAFDGDYQGIPVIKYEAALDGEVEKPGLGPLHTEFDGKGFAYTSHFLSSDVVKWDLKTKQVVDKQATFYSIGHLCIPGGDSKQPWGKYLVAMNKITKDRYLPTGPELTQSAQLYDISGDKMKLLLDFPTTGEPHYAQACPAELLVKNSTQIYKIEENEHPYATKGESQAKVTREGNKVHVYMSSIRSHFAPDNIEGIKVGDEVYWHVTNLEQDFDVPHGFTVKGANNGELLIMPGETCTLKWVPTQAGVYPFYCTDFCSALHQEMQGYVRVSPAGSSTPLKWTLDGNAPGATASK